MEGNASDLLDRTLAASARRPRRLEPWRVNALERACEDPRGALHVAQHAYGLACRRTGVRGKVGRMFSGSVLLRLFLIVVLALNGASTAVAATHLPLSLSTVQHHASGDGEAVTEVAPRQDHAGCHGAQAPGHFTHAAATHAAATPAPSTHAPAKQHTATELSGTSAEHASGGHASGGHASPMHAQTGHDGGDCCESGACRCDCLHAAQEALPRTDEGAVAIVRAHEALLPARAHPAPALPAPVRPPIG